MARYPGCNNLSLLERLLNKIKINEVTDCWEWQASVNNIGYGFIRDEGKMRTAHRVSYEQHIGPIPLGKQVLHTCDNPKCVNPNHLWIGTIKDNMQDKVKKGRCNSIGMLGKNHKLDSCKHCGVIKPVNILAKHHNDKCKDKP
jgi:hypothetical protein